MRRSIYVFISLLLIAYSCSDDTDRISSDTSDRDALLYDSVSDGVEVADKIGGDYYLPDELSDNDIESDDGFVPDADTELPDGGIDVVSKDITKPRVVYRAADDSLPMGENLLKNPDFEKIESNVFADWKPYRGGYSVSEGRSGYGVLLQRNEGDTEQYGIYQTVTLNQKVKKALFFAGWSKTENLSGVSDAAASIYLDIKYITKDEDPINGCDPNIVPNCALYGQIPNPKFDTGTHDYQKRYGYAVPLYPVKTVSFYLLLRGEHYGKMWFDDVELREVEYEIAGFVSAKIAVVPPPAGYKSAEEVLVETGDSLILRFSENGGVINGLYAGGKDLKGSSRDYLSGIIIHEIGKSEWVHTGGLFEKTGNNYTLKTDMKDYDIQLTASFDIGKDTIGVHIELEGVDSKNKSFTVYFSLPVDITDSFWGRDIRRELPTNSADEFSDTVTFWYDRLGYTGRFSSYPIGSVYNKEGGIVLGLPPESYRIHRVFYNRSLKQLVIAVDMAIAPKTKKFPDKAFADFILYRTENIGSENGFRVAFDGFYKRFPQAFERRIPPEKEGIWVAFADLSKVINGEGESIRDFNIGIHETGNLKHIEFDEANDILTFRYIIEPGSTWLRIPDESVDVENYESVIDYLSKLYTSGSDREKKTAEKTFSSGIFDENQRFVYTPYQSGPTWCSGKCALFYLSADPDISIPPYTLNQATYSVNEVTLGVYKNYPGLDGEYIDSFLMWATYLNQREAHFEVTDTPLVFKTEKPNQVGIPLIFSTIKFTEWLKRQLPLGKNLIANGVLAGKVMWGYNLFDFMGQEIKWVKESTNGYELVPESDEYLSYRRSLSYQRPYGFLMNVDFNNMSYEMVEKYIRVCLFYGIYPSMFSRNASEDNYFTLPQFYQRDRGLFKKYIPLIKEMNKAGWEALTQAYTYDKDVYIERFGDIKKGLYYTIRNVSDTQKYVIITLVRNALGINGDFTVKEILDSGEIKQIKSNESSFDFTIQPQSIKLVKIESISGQ